MQSDLGASIGSDGRIVVPAAMAYGFGPTGAPSFTISVLVMTSAPGTVLSYNGPDIGTAGMLGWILAIDAAGNPRFAIAKDQDANWLVYQGTAPASLLDGNWHQLVVTGNNGTIGLQIDGAAIAVAAPTAMTVPSNSGIQPSLSFGRTPVPNQPFPQFVGIIEDVILFLRALSADEITACRFNLIAGNAADLVGLWRMNGNANDESPVGNNGRKAGTVTFLPVFHTVWANGANSFSYVSMETRYGTPDYGPHQSPRRAAIEAFDPPATITRRQKLTVAAGAPYLAFLIYGDDGTFAYPPNVQCVITKPNGTTISADANSSILYVKMSGGSPWQVLAANPDAGTWTLSVTAPSSAEFTVGFQTFPSTNIRPSIEAALGPCFADDWQAEGYESRSDYLFATGAGIITALAAASGATPTRLRSNQAVEDAAFIAIPVILLAGAAILAIGGVIWQSYLTSSNEAKLSPPLTPRQVPQVVQAGTKKPLVEVRKALIGKVGWPATTNPANFATRSDLGIDRNYQLIFDLGGEGYHTVNGITSGFADAINFNDHANDRAHPQVPIPNLVLLNSFTTAPPYPVADAIGNYIVEQDAPLTDKNVSEIARLIAPGGRVGLWIDRTVYAPQLASLAAALQTQPVFSEIPGSSCKDEFNGQLRYKKTCLRNESSGRVIFYAPTFSDMSYALNAAQRGYITHVLIGLFHLGYDDEGRKTGPYIHLNDWNVTDPRYDDLWGKVTTLQGRGVRVLASLGGAEVGDFTNMFTSDATYATFYAKLKDALTQKKLDGIDLDIEEGGKPGQQIVNTTNVTKLVDDLRRDFASRANGFLITSAPVPSALTGGRNISPYVDYNSMFSKFDFCILQFYNGFGNLKPSDPNTPHYANVVTQMGAGSARKLVAGVLTNPSDAGSPQNPVGWNSLSDISSFLPDIIGSYPHFGGICGWTYQNALNLAGAKQPYEWSQTMAGMVRPRVS